ncbi:Trehalose utilization [Rubripirellula tenax]|uniref:Trehalose utilization n=1 Tax=Rubripirellula tenax TaxID=2528015 RepID=A0A5C6EJ80_9BACT|nr:ThuA domain-containing protein [Rubripirellula tenax]TWU48878.1 Trehalose utilization [Rubripirellula tenax]
MKRFLFTLVAAFMSAIVVVPAHAQETAPTQPLKVLLVIGGCCHDYTAQSKILKEGIEQRIRADVTVEFSEDTSTGARFGVYESDDWAEGYDVILHDECSASVTERPYVDRILAEHANGTPAVNLHCAMHSYRWGDYKQPVEPGADNAGWYEMIGVQSSSHGPKAPIDVDYISEQHPIVKGLEDWATTDDELYNNVRVFGSAESLASGKQVQGPKGKKSPQSKPKVATAVVAWTNLYGPKKTRIFSTTLGHFNETVNDTRYLDLVVRGLLWTTGNLNDDGTPMPGFVK